MAIFQDGGCRHLGFWKFQIFYGWYAQEGGTASACQILSKSLKTRLRYDDFSIFQDGGRPPSWIFKSGKFQLPVPFGGPICVPLHGPVQFASIRGVRLVGNMFSAKIAFTLWGSSPHLTHCSLCQAHLSSQTASRSIRSFFVWVPMLCCTMHCQWGRNPAKLPISVGMSSPCQRRTELDRRQHAQNIW